MDLTANTIMALPSNPATGVWVARYLDRSGIVAFPTEVPWGEDLFVS